VVKFTTALQQGVLVRRYKRFLADVRLDDGTLVTAHTANPGAMTGLVEPGRRVALSYHAAPKRKLAYSWELLRLAKRWVGVNPMHSNALVADAIGARRIAALEGYDALRREVPLDDARIDMLLSDADASRRCWVEVKTATLVEHGVARFPDAPTARGRRHLALLEQVVRRRRAGERAALCFVVQRSDVDVVAPADRVDAAYGAGLRRAAAHGVEVFAIGCHVGLSSIVAQRTLEIDLG
jgi:sugar fermentation stimulation protein A